MMLNKLSQGFAWQIDPLIERVPGRSPGRCPPLQYRHLAIAHLHEQICSALADAIAIVHKNHRDLTIGYECHHRLLEIGVRTVNG